MQTTYARTALSVRCVRSTGLLSGPVEIHLPYMHDAHMSILGPDTQTNPSLLRSGILCNIYVVYVCSRPKNIVRTHERPAARPSLKRKNAKHACMRRVRARV